jgi:cation diffusion facilitator family transporter
MTPQAQRTAAIRRVLWLILALNLAVAAAKLTWGHLTGSLSMWADGVHSLFDGTANVVGLVGIWAAARPASDCHPYGHRKFETFASFGISVLLFVACAHILYDSYQRFVGGGVPNVTGWSFVVITATMVVNAFVIRYEHRKGDALKSDVLHADAVHTQTDLYASLAVVASLAATKGNLPVVDPIVAVLIAGLIGRAGFGILAETSRVLSDSARVDPGRIQEIALQVEGVLGCHGIRTRGTQHHIYVDCHITVPHDMTAEHAHELVHQVEGRIRAEMAEIVDVVIHIEPVRDALIRVER